MAQLRAAFSTALSTFFAAADLPGARAAIKVIGSEGNEKMTAPLLKDGNGAHLVNASGGMPNGEVFLTPAGASDPRTKPGQWWVTY